MAWNPSKEVAIARDAAKDLGDAEICIVYWIKGEKFGMASYGRTRPLCSMAKIIGDAGYEQMATAAGNLL